MMATVPPAVPVAIVGLPSSGKTTFLAALWHLVSTSELSTKLSFGSLGGDDYNYLNGIMKQWRRAKEQDRTQLKGMQSVVINLKDDDGRYVRVTFPDVPGEEYTRMWEQREVHEDLARTLASGNIMLLLNGKQDPRARVGDRADCYQGGSRRYGSRRGTDGLASNARAHAGAVG